MAATCPMCDKPFKTDTELAQHMPNCSYPKKNKERK